MTTQIEVVPLATDRAPVRLESRAAIDQLVRIFYREVSKDERLGYIFNTVIGVDWTEHMDHMVDYWARILLREPGYRGTIQLAHSNIHALHPLNATDFDRWYDLWTRTLDMRFCGPNAQQARVHAAKIATMLARRVAGIEWRPRSLV